MNKGQWLDNLLDELGWDPADLARATGLDSAVISNIKNGKRGTGFDTAQKIAEATKRPLEEIYRRAGLLPPESPDDELDKRIKEIVKRFPLEEKRKIVKRLELEAQFYEPSRRTKPANKPRT